MKGDFFFSYEIGVAHNNVRSCIRFYIDDSLNDYQSDINRLNTKLTALGAAESIIAQAAWARYPVFIDVECNYDFYSDVVDILIEKWFIREKNDKAITSDDLVLK